MKTIVYLHGFISSPQSKKAVMLGDYVRNCAEGLDYRVPGLHHRPARAMTQVAAACEGVAVDDLTLVGSSLGGFYATAHLIDKISGAEGRVAATDAPVPLAPVPEPATMVLLGTGILAVFRARKA